MGKIKIENTSPVAKIFIDGKEVDKIKGGQTKEYVVEDGVHEVFAKAAWCGSQKLKLNITNDETTTLKLSGFEHENLLKAIIFGLIAIFMFTKIIAFLFIAMAVFIFPLYFITFGKDKYLVLVEKELVETS